MTRRDATFENPNVEKGYDVAARTTVWYVTAFHNSPKCEHATPGGVCEYGLRVASDSIEGFYEGDIPDELLESAKHALRRHVEPPPVPQPEEGR